jgi:hypothetical protein
VHFPIVQADSLVGERPAIDWGELALCAASGRQTPLGLPKARTVEANDVIVSAEEVNEAADGHVLDHRSIPMEKNDHRISRIATFDIV